MKYQCEKCEKTFESARALGGHVSSHNRGESYKENRKTENSINQKGEKNSQFGTRWVYNKTGECKKIKKEELEKYISSGWVRGRKIGEKEKIPKICEYCNAEFEGHKLAGHKILCKMNPKREERLAKLLKSQIGRKHTEFSKNLMSESMKKAHNEGRAWNIGKSRWNNKKSYPEEFFERVIENNFSDKGYKTEYPVSIYAIDFAWVDKKKAIEIDGEQHQRFKEYIERDKRKDQTLIEKGWQILRIKWKDMYNDPKYWIQEAYDFIH